MQASGIVTKHATSDADVLIAKTAIQLTLKVQTALLGEYTDPPTSSFTFFMSLPRQSLSFDQIMTK